MIKKLLIFAAAAAAGGFPFNVGAEDFPPLPAPAPPTCAQRVFARALAATQEIVKEDDPEYIIQAWIYKSFQNPDVVRAALACPEVADLDDQDTIRFPVVGFMFPNGREIRVNYTTQPKILKQRLLMAGKRGLPGAASERIDATGDWSNTEPAWYGILVVQAGSLDEYVGPDKNNTLSLQYLKDNIDRFYPARHNNVAVWTAGGLVSAPMCTSTTALADDDDIINIAAHRTVGEDEKSFWTGNDFYVAGDASLQWITWAEVTADVVFTALTWGGGAFVVGAAKSARGVRVSKNLIKTMTELVAKSDDVADFIKVAGKMKRVEKELDAAKAVRAAGRADDLRGLETSVQQLRAMEDLVNKSKDVEKFIEQSSRLKAIDRELSVATDAAKIKTLQEETKTLTTGIRELEKLDDVRRYRNIESVHQTRTLETELASLKAEAQAFDKIGDVQKYKEIEAAFADIEKWRKAMKAIKYPQTGNIVARTWRAARALNSGTKVLDKGGKLARAGMSTRSAKIRDWLFHQTLKKTATLAKLESKAGFLYGALKFVGDAYDWSETSVGDYTSNIEFTPLGLLSADNLKEGQENVVNHGMWLMWAGDSVNPADDDAAFLQTADFADKFYQEMAELQDDYMTGKSVRLGALCDVDIYVVRPIIRNPESDSPELYYLIMNDVPWMVRSN